MMITLNVNSLQTPIKEQTVKWIKRKQELTICCLWETHLKHKPQMG